MLKYRMKRQTAFAQLAVDRLADIRSSIEALGNEDLLDLADIFAGRRETHLWEIASAEMLKRDLRL